MHRPIVLGLYFIFVFVSGAAAQGELRVGMPAPSGIVGSFVTGIWAEKGTASPVHLHRDSPKIAVFAKTLDERMLPLATKIDELVAGNLSLKWSFLFLSHENDPTPADDAWESQLKSLKNLASNNTIKHISIGVMLRIADTGRPGRSKRRLGFLKDGDVVVMLIAPDAAGNGATIQYVQIIKPNQLEQNSIEQIIRDLRMAIAEAGLQG
jgi:hypothetical protein